MSSRRRANSLWKVEFFEKKILVVVNSSIISSISSSISSKTTIKTFVVVSSFIIITGAVVGVKRLSY